MSMILVMLRSSTNLGLREVVSEEPHPKHEPQPHANTCTDEKGKVELCQLRSIYREMLSIFMKRLGVKVLMQTNGVCTSPVTSMILNCHLAIKRLVKYYLTCPAEVRAKDDWLPAHTFLMMNPCRASITLGQYTRLVSP